MLENGKKSWYIDPEDMEFKDTMKNARKKLEVPLESAMPRKNCYSEGETRCTQDNSRKTRHACIIGSPRINETRISKTEARDHEDLSGYKGFTSFTHCNSVHKPIPTRQAMKILDSKAAVDMEWKKLRKSAGMASDEMQEQKRGHPKGTKRGNDTSLCHANGLVPH